MIKIKRVNEDFLQCGSCYKKDREVPVYWVSIVQESKGGSNSNTFKICKNCLTDLQKLIGEVIG
jgi:hypothetical protein